jgi:alkane 1-monooxygenase
MDRSSPLLFLARHLVPLAMIAGWATGALWTFKFVSWLWLAVTAIDTMAGPDTRNPPDDPDPSARGVARRLEVALWVVAPAAMLGCGLALMACECATLRELAVVTVSIGIATGILSVSAAHELIHGRSRVDHVLGELLMTMMTYPHFCIAHVEGHHRDVGTADDPATARWGESFYGFYNRTLFGGVVTAWCLETSRLEALNVPVWGPRNRMLRYAATLTVVYAAMAYAFGALGVAFFAVQSIVAFSLIEVINYVEHYGLARRLIAPGRYERVRPWHSWNSSHRASNWLLLNLGRHSDHHCHPEVGYRDLRHAADAPQLPAGYFGVLVLPLIPPLWRRVIDPRVHAWRLQHGVPLDILTERRSRGVDQSRTIAGVSILAARGRRSG